MKKFLFVEVTRRDGSKFINELKLSEAYLISQLAQEHAVLIVRLEKCSHERYKSIFG